VVSTQLKNSQNLIVSESFPQGVKIKYLKPHPRNIVANESYITLIWDDGFSNGNSLSNSRANTETST